MVKDAVQAGANQTIADVLEEIAELLELKGEGAFRIRAYENAARTIRHTPLDIEDLASKGKLRSIPGVGDALALKIQEYLSSGEMAYLDNLRLEFPSGVRQLMAIPGVGPKLAARVYHELGIDTVEHLELAAQDGRLARMPRLGQRSADNVLRAIDRYRRQETQRVPIGDALPYVRMVLEGLRDQDFVQNLTVAGSLRRFVETIKDVDIIATSDDPDRAFDFFMTLRGIRDVVARGPTKLSIISDRNLQIDFRIVPAESYGSLLQHFTGSKAHNVQLREYALKQGLSLSEYGIAAVESGDRTTFTDEAAFYAALGLPWIAPELREGTGELAAALDGNLPELVVREALRGDLHVHSDWSDGTATIEAMVTAAAQRGYEYVAITDHSASRPGGLDPDGVSRQRLTLEEVQRSHPEIRILRGIEVDIKNDGSLDLPDDVLAGLDWVVASAHTTFNMERDRMTARMVAAIENPNVDAIGHPTGRIVGGRPPYDVDIDSVIAAAASTGTALEVNASPKRMDLKDSYVRRAIEAGVSIVIDTDAHSVTELGHIDFGIQVARRGWAEAGAIVNTRKLEDLLRSLGH